MPGKNKSAFTLVELIVVITILAILGTVAFVSFQDYVGNSRDSKRTTDIKNIEKALELSKLQTGVYPNPGTSTNITYSGATAWKQGEFNNDVVRVVRNFKEAPKDPLVDSFYAYSVTKNRGEYQLGGVLEDIDYGTSANGKLAGAYVKGNYNGKTVKVSTGSTTYVLAAPSILTSDLNETDLLDIINAKKLVYKGHKNLPASYTGTTYDVNGGFEFSPQSGTIVAYEGDLATVDSTTLVDNLQKIYTGTTVVSESDIVSIFDKDKELTAKIILGKKIIGSVNNNSTNTEGGNGGNTILIDQTTCEDASWMWIDSVTDVYIGSSQGSGFCISPRVGDFGDSTGNGISFNGWGDNTGGNYNGWNYTNIDDSGNLDPANSGQTRQLDSSSGYTCRALGTSSTDFDTTDNIVGRMKWLATNKSNLVELQDIEWIQNATPPNGHPVPALYLSDCIDGVKDLGTTMIYTHNNDTTDEVTYTEYSTDSSNTHSALLNNITYQNRQKYLTAWTQKRGSHLPSAMSYISSGSASASDTNGGFLTGADRGEYQVACEASLLTDGNDNGDLEMIWTSAIGTNTGTDWGRSARLAGYAGCGHQYYSNTGHRGGFVSARFVVRP